MARAATPEWQRALQEFIAPYRAQRDVIGALVCGSYVTGAPSPRSDIDVVIVLSPRVKQRERGNRIVGGHLLEYFANPPAQFRAYFANDHARNRMVMATMFATGRVLFDPRGAVKTLREHARRWLARPFPLPKRGEIAAERYFFWDLLDN
ncbi:MAG TPA: nucleotidyltransferase domain-containing protein, partial [Polyangiales bacterium]|nr:nucleotidyltransferase domain-containing protein [Polyangiales bacterium]